MVRFLRLVLKSLVEFKLLGIFFSFFSILITHSLAFGNIDQLNGQGTLLLSASDDSSLKLQIQELRPEGAKPQAVVVIVHGIQESGIRYLDFARELVEKNLAVWILDLRGHGNSGGRRVYVDSFEQYVEDLDVVVNEARQHYPDQKLFIFAHSMGGLIAFRYETERALVGSVDGYILSSPALKIKMSTENSIKNSLATLPWLSDHLKDVEIAPGIDYENLVTDKNILNRMNTAVQAGHPLIYPKITIRLGTELYAATLNTQDLASRFHSPVIMLSTSQDQIIDPVGTRTVFGLIPELYKPKRFDHDEAKHEILNSVPKVRNQAIAEVIEFIEGLIGP